MNSLGLDELERLCETGGGGALLRRLTDDLRGEWDWHRLFDALLLTRKYQLGLPLNRPTSMEDVPRELRREVEEAYFAAAREAGDGLLAAGDIPAAWMYFQAIREPDRMTAALGALPDRIDDDRFEPLVRIALFEGANPVKGVRMLLAGAGMCNTITSLDQMFPQLPPGERDLCARELVRALHAELFASLTTIIAQRTSVPDARSVRDTLAARTSAPTDSPPDPLPFREGEKLVPGSAAIHDLIAGHAWLFDNGSYHVDISHLQAVIRFARSITTGAPELELARDLARYGAQLDRALQYPGDPPFEDFFPAHEQFFNVLLDDHRDEALDSFRSQLQQEPDERDRAVLAYVLVDLLDRAGKLDEAIDVAAAHLLSLGEEVRLSVEDLCLRAGRFDKLKQLCREQGNVVGYAAAVIQESSSQ